MRTCGDKNVSMNIMKRSNELDIFAISFIRSILAFFALLPFSAWILKLNYNYNNNCCVIIATLRCEEWISWMFTLFICMCLNKWEWHKKGRNPEMGLRLKKLWRCVPLIGIEQKKIKSFWNLFTITILTFYKASNEQRKEEQWFSVWKFIIGFGNFDFLSSLIFLRFRVFLLFLVKFLSFFLFCFNAKIVKNVCENL